MGKIEEFGKVKTPLTDEEVKIFACFGFRMRKDHTKLGDRRKAGYVPQPKIRYLLPRVDGTTLEFPYRYDFHHFYHYFIERGGSIHADDLLNAPFYNEIYGGENGT